MTTTTRQKQIVDFLSLHGFASAQIHPLAGDASFRRYLRIHKPGKTAMLMDAPPEKENIPSYLAVAEHLCACGYSAPVIIAHDVSLGLMLLEDLGDDLFTSVVKQHPDMERELYRAAIDVLTEWHTKEPSMANPGLLALPVYDHHLLMQEVRLFADWYLPQVVGKEEAIALGAEYVSIWARILKRAALSTDHFVHRDYHADNLMWLPQRQGLRRVGMLDFQDAVYGDTAYDLASLLEDARRDVPDVLVSEMLDRYLAATGKPRDRFLTAYHVLAAQRNSKIVGIFVRLAARDGKYQYLNFLPRVWNHLERDLEHPEMTELKRWLETHIPAGARGAVTIRHTSQELALTA